MCADSSPTAPGTSPPPPTSARRGTWTTLAVDERRPGPGVVHDPRHRQLSWPVTHCSGSWAWRASSTLARVGRGHWTMRGPRARATSHLAPMAAPGRWGQWPRGGGVIRTEGETAERFLADATRSASPSRPTVGCGWRSGMTAVRPGASTSSSLGPRVSRSDAAMVREPGTSSPGASGSPLIAVSEVNLVGEAFFERATDETDVRRCSGVIVEPATVADGRFLSESQCWDEGAVWWEDATRLHERRDECHPGPLGRAPARGLVPARRGHRAGRRQRRLLLSYRDPETGSWLPLWTVPPACSFGMATRPVPGDTSARQVLPIIVTTDALRFEAEFGDGMYSVSEIQLFGEPVVDDAMPPDEASVSTETGPPSPGPTETAAATTSTTSAAAVSPGAPPVSVAGAQGLAWSKVFEVPAPFVVESIVAAHDRFYALANDHDAGYYSPSVMWTSEDGTDWVELDVAELFSDGASLHSIVASERGLLALGFRPAPEGHAATAWFSSDGVTWDASDLGYVVEPATQPYTTSLLSFSAAALGSSGARGDRHRVPRLRLDGRPAGRRSGPARRPGRDRPRPGRDHLGVGAGDRRAVRRLSRIARGAGPRRGG